MFTALQRCVPMARLSVSRTSPRWSRSMSLFSAFRSGGTEEEVDIEAASKDLHNEVLAPLNDKILGPLEKYSDQLTPMPMVFVLGNHSSGKSTFINYVAHRDVQTTGVAPTDDGFTILVPGHKDADQDGPALVGDPDLGFNGLRHFGTALMNHVNLKVRSGLSVDNIMLVDSPGMIDAPVNSGIGAGTRNASDFVGNMNSSRDRGYDFPAVVRWFAERADVVLLFFDPDKPGTTGETLACMTQSLSGLDHKVHIMLNKVDQFRNVHDFARAYGSLCWNLSKVIPRKDLPRIYTTCVPVKQSNPASLIQEAMADLQSAREEVIGEVVNAPMRRLDNVISRLDDSTRVLKMYASVCERVRKEYKSLLLRYNLGAAAVAVTSASAAWGAVMTGLPNASVPLALVGVAGTGGLWWLGQRAGAEKIEHLVDRGGLDEAFRTVYYLQLAESDDYVVALWERVRPKLQRTIRTMGLRKLPSVSSKEIADLDDILDSNVPTYRRQNTKSTAFSITKNAEKARAALEKLAAQNSSSDAPQQ